MKSSIKRLKFLFIAGLFSKSAINAGFAERAKQQFGAFDSDIVSIDLECCKSVKEALQYISSWITILGGRVVIIGHSAGGQLATHFIDNMKVSLVVSVCGPSHNPLDYPAFLWPSTTKYLWDTATDKFFRPTDGDSTKIFGRTVPMEMRGDSWGWIVGQMNFGLLAGNSSAAEVRLGSSLFVTCTGDRLITPNAVLKNCLRLRGEYLELDHPDHYPMIGPKGDKNIDCILLEVRRMLQYNDN